MPDKNVPGDYRTLTVPEAFSESGINAVTCLFVHDSGRIGDYTANVTYHPYTESEAAF